MVNILNENEVRVLGSLIEKSLATPDNYPLSLNGLTNACNQKSNREPVVFYEELHVQQAVHDLVEKGLAHQSNIGRVPKYEELLTRERNLVARESAVLCVLLLRGAQTAGEIRVRTARLYNYDSLEAVLETLSHLEEWDYIRKLPRLAGHKESRYVHLFAGEPQDAAPEQAPAARNDAPQNAERLDEIEAAIDTLRDDLESLKDAFQAFKQQFE